MAALDCSFHHRHHLISSPRVSWAPANEPWTTRRAFFPPYPKTLLGEERGGQVCSFLSCGCRTSIASPVCSTRKVARQASLSRLGKPGRGRRCTGTLRAVAMPSARHAEGARRPSWMGVRLATRARTSGVHASRPCRRADLARRGWGTTSACSARVSGDWPRPGPVTVVDTKDLTVRPLLATVRMSGVAPPSFGRRQHGCSGRNRPRGSSPPRVDEPSILAS